MAARRVLSARRALTAGAVIVGAAVWIGPRVASVRLSPTDFERELRAIDDEIAGGGSMDADSQTKLAYRLYQRASLTDRPDDFETARSLLVRTIERVGPSPDLRLLQATLALRFHQLDAARSAIHTAPQLAESAEAQALVADIDLQQGRYDQANAEYEAVVRQRPTWAALARYAFLTGRRGDAPGADRLYANAEDEVTAKEMRAYAWLELQRGQLRFSRGQYDEALAHYLVAGRAYSGYWLVDEYMAELKGALRQFDEAVALYERAIARAPRPDLLQQLGDLYVFMGRPREAKRWHDAALAGYLASVGRGEVQFFHHLAAFYADVAQDSGEAAKWAAEDLRRRPNYASQDMMAWALYRSGRVADALALAERTMASGITETHLFDHAATINAAAGRADEAGRIRMKLASLNPRHDDFHVHR